MTVLGGQLNEESNILFLFDDTDILMHITGRSRFPLQTSFNLETVTKFSLSHLCSLFFFL